MGLGELDEPIEVNAIKSYVLRLPHPEIASGISGGRRDANLFIIACWGSWLLGSGAGRGITLK